MELQNIVVIYHGNCRDGFGAAFAAWKKFGDTATYIPQKTQTAVPEGLTNKEIYIVDYSYPKDVLESLRAQNTSVVVIDHHKTAEAALTTLPGNVFDLEHSGAVLAWQYFHPETAVPMLLQYVEDHDLWKFVLPQNREFGAALGEYPMDFATWDTLVTKLADEEFQREFIAHGTIIAKYEDKLVENMLEYRERAQFEGHEIYVLNASQIYRSILGNRLAALNAADGHPPMGIVYYRYGGGVHCSLRSRDGFNVRELAEKYGGGGHDQAASFRVESFKDLPFTFLP